MSCIRPLCWRVGLALFVSVPLQPALAGDQTSSDSSDTVPITSKVSLVHLGSIDSFTITEGGIQAGRLLLDGLQNGLPKNDLTQIQKAKTLYDALIPKENYGGEYTALEWFCHYLLADEKDRAELLTDKFHQSFFDFFAANDYANLKEYLGRKYHLTKFNDTSSDEGHDRIAFLEDFMLFNNPRREEWEQTRKIIEALKIPEGTTIADVGSGPGYYSFKFSQLVGPSGKIYAIDTVQKHLDYIKSVCEKYNISNIEAVKDRADGIGVAAQSADLVFMCSLYHIIYTTDTEEVKDRFINSIKTALKPGGRFVVVDNAVVQDGSLPYHGPHIAKELIIGQLHYYGFSLTEQYQFIPQRYVLVFKLADKS
jgi:ubiquinone/menaquinone biosynthesis C-methylase UbiE